MSLQIYFYQIRAFEKIQMLPIIKTESAFLVYVEVVSSTSGLFLFCSNYIDPFFVLSVWMQHF